jgi:hypothetical protein
LFAARWPEKAEELKQARIGGEGNSGSINAPEENYRCSTCGATLRRIYTSPAITFRGSGFYTNDK